jgi:hypothetical protein
MYQRIMRAPNILTTLPHWTPLPLSPDRCPALLTLIEQFLSSSSSLLPTMTTSLSPYTLPPTTENAPIILTEAYWQCPHHLQPNCSFESH